MEERKKWEPRWKAIRDYQLDSLGCFENTADESDPARRRDDSILNGIAWRCCQIFSAGVMSGLTPPSRPWFRFAFSDEALSDDVEASAALDARLELTMAVLQKSNFYNAMHSVYMELPFGQCPLAVLHSPEKAVRFAPFTVGTYALAAGEDGRVDTFAHSSLMTAHRLREMFGEESLPQVVRTALTGNRGYSTKFRLCWLVEKNDAGEGKGRFFLPFRSLYWLDGAQDKDFLYVGGFSEWPIPTARFLVNGREAYGRGPGWFAEGDSKMLQVLEMDYLTAVELSVKPTVQATADVVAQGINLIPGAVTVVESLDKPVTPLFQVNVDLEHIRIKIADVEERIKNHYAANLFLMLEMAPIGKMTATEAMIRNQEKLQQLGPMVERLQYEFLSPVIERVYAVLERAGVFPPLPPGLAERLNGREVKIDYISPLAQAQKLSGTVTIEQLLGFVGQMYQLWPEVKEKIDPIETVNRYAEGLGAPATIRRSDEAAMKIIAQQRQQAAEEKQAALLLSAAPAANQAAQAAKNMTEAAGDNNPALESLLGMRQ
jgi:hypothetical protein